MSFTKGEKMDVTRKYPNFKNSENSCWLDSCLALVANNSTFHKAVTNVKDSHLNKIITQYHKALAILNDSEEKTKALKQSNNILNLIQRTSLTYLKKYLKFKVGERESAFCALLNLIIQDNSPIKDHLFTTWIWHKKCSNCKAYSKAIADKTIVTLSKVEKFHPTAPTTFYTCSCKLEEKMKGEYKAVSDCLIFHFERGAGKEGNIPSKFYINKRSYHLTGVVIFEDTKGLGKDHFFTLVRDPVTQKWIQFDDTDDAFVCFLTVKPELKLEDIFLSIYETFDGLGITQIGTFSNKDISTSEQAFEIINLIDDDSPLMDLSTPADSKIECLASSSKDMTSLSVVTRKAEDEDFEKERDEIIVRTDSPFTPADSKLECLASSNKETTSLGVVKMKSKSEDEDLKKERDDIIVRADSPLTDLSTPADSKMECLASSIKDMTSLSVVIQKSKSENGDLKKERDDIIVRADSPLTDLSIPADSKMECLASSNNDTTSLGMDKKKKKYEDKDLNKKRDEIIARAVQNTFAAFFAENIITKLQREEAEGSSSSSNLGGDRHDIRAAMDALKKSYANKKKE